MFSILGGGGDWLCRNVGNVSVLNHEGEPMDITQARVCTRVCTLQTKRNIYACEHLNLSQFTISRKWKKKWNDRVMTELSASDALILSETTDTTYAYSCFHLFPLYFSCGLYILKKREDIYFVLNRLFFKVSAWNKSFFFFSLIFIYDCSDNILIIGL